ncbi:MAG: DinB family protein [Candidatus Dormibacteraeota bacterium]|uniref:DinB family protein n=1 Tax=Candidatus Aeolococcus gillhamiae TaxID=3127015 RepID=A0A2W5ZFJ5_9BACT|nr:DinB family protein [Candidatus Dormibacteraeota bacterium]PZR84143.1 MAG: Mini-circle protein [Candidatus Dormibacter sp. RRmetagenome_bin12]
MPRDTSAAPDSRRAQLHVGSEQPPLRRRDRAPPLCRVGPRQEAGIIARVIPEDSYSPVWTNDTRSPLPLVGEEREMLTAFLEWHRATFELKCSGVPAERLSEQPVPPSTMSLHGLVRHLAAVERWWFRIQFAGEDVPLLYYSDDDPDQDFDSLDGDVAQAFEVWRTECDRAREIVRNAGLDDTAIQRRTSEPISLRRILVTMIAEYARHDGHADLLRERIDGATGY